jgi:hypothetical protein
MLPKRKPTAANRHTRRAQGVKLVKVKRGGPPAGPSPLVALLKRAIDDNDPAVVATEGIMGGEKGWLFHSDGACKYAIGVGKTRVTLHSMPMYANPQIHRSYKKLINNGDFGKGCIRFKPDAAIDATIIARFIRDCAKAPFTGSMGSE